MVDSLVKEAWSYCRQTGEALLLSHHWANNQLWNSSVLTLPSTQTSGHAFAQPHPKDYPAVALIGCYDFICHHATSPSSQWLKETMCNCLVSLLQPLSVFVSEHCPPLLGRPKVFLFMKMVALECLLLFQKLQKCFSFPFFIIFFYSNSVLTAQSQLHLLLGNGSLLNIL